MSGVLMGMQMVATQPCNDERKEEGREDIHGGVPLV
jgi:hypothetical protein